MADLKKMALDYHEEGRPGKIEVIPTKPYTTQKDLALAYSPGVAYPCLEIEQHPEDAYKYTDKGNLVAVISNGTAVLGLGDIGALAGKPVMEGKALLFKIFAGLDSFDIEVNEKDPDKLVDIVKAISPTFGGINLEDIKAPECFKIEKRLKEELDIPVMHDDQHGTAIISAAGLLNALEIQDKKIDEIRLVVNGAGAAAISCTRLYEKLGVRPENVVMCDSKGVIRADREGLSPQKKEFATTRDLHTLAEAMVGADVFLGLSVADVVTPEMLLSMAPKPIVFALANPNPEIDYDLAVKTRDDLILATGRSDYPNQINNVIGFPYIFRGALDSRATAINEEMKVAAVFAIAHLAKEPVPMAVDKAYGGHHLSFGRDYILPKALDPRLLLVVAPAVAKGAMDSGVAKKPITDWEQYQEQLRKDVGEDSSMLRRIQNEASSDPQMVTLGDGESDNVIRAAQMLVYQGICKVTLLGNRDVIKATAERLQVSLDGINIIEPWSDEVADQREKYAQTMAQRLQRKGMTLRESRKLMRSARYFGLMMAQMKDTDAYVARVESAADSTAKLAETIIGIKDGFSHFATMHIMHTRRGLYFLADTAINPVSDKEALVDIARLADYAVRFFTHKPVLAMLSYSNFGSKREDPEPKRIAEAVAELHENYPDIAVDGEMQANYALDTKLRDQLYPFNTIKGKTVNTLIFPNLSSANVAYRLMLGMGVGTMIGPVQIGLRRPVYFASSQSDPRDIVNLVSVAALEAVVEKRKNAEAAK